MGRVLNSPLISLVILVIGSQFFQIFISLALVNSGHSEFDVGLIHTASYAGLLISALFSESLIHRIGHIRAFTAFSSVITVTVLAQAFAVNLYFWIVARFCSGLALAALYVTIESWLLAESTVLDRGKRLAIYMITLYFSQAISPQILHVIDINSVQPYLFAALMCSLAIIPVSLTNKTTPMLPHRVPLKIREIFKLNPYGFMGCMVSGLALSALYSFMPNFSKEYNLSIPWAMTTLICGGFLLQWPLGKLSDIFNREKVLISLSSVCIIPTILLTVLPSNQFTYVLIFITGGLTFALYPISIAATCDFIENKCIVQATGVLLFAYGLGSVAGPLLAAKSIYIVGSNGVLFAYIAAVVGGFGLTGAMKWLKSQLKAPPVDLETVDCVPLPHQSPLANQLDPRQEVDEESGSIINMQGSANEEIVKDFQEDKLDIS